MVSYGNGRTTSQELVSGKMKKKIILLIIVSAIIGLGIVYMLWLSKLDSKKAYEIAVVSMSGERKEDGIAMIRGVQLYIDQVNASGGVFGKPVYLNIYDDRGDPKLARQIAASIVENKNILLVIGHFFSSTSFAAGQIYKKYGIPAITASATDPLVTQNNPWFFRIIPNNETQGQFISAYINGALNQNRACIVYDTDNYGKSLSTAFESNASELGIHITKQWGLDTTKAIDDQIKRIVEELRSLEDCGVIFLATHSIEAVKLISAINFPGASYTIFGPDALSTFSFINEFNRFPQERATPGYFSDNVFATSPFMINISSNPNAFKLSNEFYKYYGYRPSWIDVCYYDAAKVAVTALKLCRMSGNHFRKDRMDIREYLASVNQKDNAIKGIAGDIYFDKFGNVARPFSVGEFKKQQFFPAFSQYQSITETPDEQQSINHVINGDIALVGNQVLQKGQVVYSGIAFNQVSNLNLYDACYEADFYLWFRFKGEFDDQNILFLNAKNPIQLNQPVFESEKDGVKTKTYHIKGVFNTIFNFKMFPFDDQNLVIKFRHASKTVEQVIYIPDMTGMKDTGVDKTKEYSQLNGIPGWKVSKTDIYQSCISKSSSFGNPLLFDSPQLISYSLLNIDISIQRDNKDVAFRTLVPLIIILIVIAFNIAIPSNRFGLKISMLIITLIPIMIYHNKLLSVLRSIRISFIESLVFVLYFLVVIYGIFAIIRYFIFRYDYKWLSNKIFICEVLFIPIIVCSSIGIFNYHHKTVMDELHSNDIKTLDAPAFGEKVQQEDVLYWTFSISPSIKNGSVIGTIHHASIDSYSLFRIIEGNSDHAFAIDNKSGKLIIQDSNIITQSQFECRELTISISDNTGKSKRAIVNVCMDSQSFDQSQSKPHDTYHSKHNYIKGVFTQKIDPTIKDETHQRSLPQVKGIGKMLDSQFVIQKNSEKPLIGDANIKRKSQNLTNEKKNNYLNNDYKFKGLEVSDQLFIIPENCNNQAVVGQIKVKHSPDDDLLFRIIRGNDAGIFSLNTVNGIISIKNHKPIKEQSSKQWFLFIEVSNQQQKKDRATITILVNHNG